MAFVTVREAASLTGKSTSAIRRAMYPIIRDDQHPDRIHFMPKVEDALDLRMRGDNFTWRIDEDWLHRAVPSEPVAERSNPSSSKSAGSDSELLFMLRRELDIKNQQITQQMELINALSERLKEGNILMGSLHQQLALPEGRDTKSPERTKPKSATPSKPEKGSATVAKNPKPKKSFFSRLFR